MFLQIRTRWDVTFDPGEVSSLAILIAEVSRTRLVAISRIQKVYTKDKYTVYCSIPVPGICSKVLIEPNLAHSEGRAGSRHACNLIGQR